MEIHKELSKVIAAPHLPKAYHPAWYLYKYTRPNPKYTWMELELGYLVPYRFEVFGIHIHICTKYATTYPEGFVMTSLYCLALFLLLCVYHLLSAIALSLASKQTHVSKQLCHLVT